MADTKRPWRCSSGNHILRTSTSSRNVIVFQTCLNCAYTVVSNGSWVNLTFNSETD